MGSIPRGFAIMDGLGGEGFRLLATRKSEVSNQRHLRVPGVYMPYIYISILYIYIDIIHIRT